jgi:hypothetical protein
MARRSNFAGPLPMFTNNRAEATRIMYPQALLISKGFMRGENLARAGNIWLAPCDWAHHEPFLREVPIGLLVHCLDPYCRNVNGVVARANACGVPVVVFSFGFRPHEQYMHAAFRRVAEALARGEDVCFYCLQSKHRSPGTLCAFLIWLGAGYQSAVNLIHEHPWTRFDQFNHVTDLLILAREFSPAPNVRQGPAVAAAIAAGGWDRPACGASLRWAPAAGAGAAGVLDRPAAPSSSAGVASAALDGASCPVASAAVDGAGVASAAVDGASCPVASAAPPQAASQSAASSSSAGVASAALDGASCPPPLIRKPGLVLTTKTGGRITCYADDTLPSLVSKSGLRPREIMRQIKQQIAFYNGSSA